LNRDYLADKYLRNRRRRLAVEGAAEAGIPFTIMGHGWETVRALEKSHVTLRPAVGFSASVQMIADAKLLLNTTPGFCGGLHDRVYTAMINGTVCFTENSRFASQELEDGVNAVLYDAKHPGALGEMLQDLWEDQKKLQSISMQASQKAAVSYSWDARARELQRLLENWVE
jgi:glycosyltransferase involved in cell wall biosynthesis